jgi:hypothetical protein
VLKNLNNEWKLKENKFVFMFFYGGFKKIQFFLRTMTICDESRLLQYDPETKQHSVQQTPPPPKIKEWKNAKSKSLVFTKTARHQSCARMVGFCITTMPLHTIHYCFSNLCHHLFLH